MPKGVKHTEEAIANYKEQILESFDDGKCTTIRGAAARIKVCYQSVYEWKNADEAFSKSLDEKRFAAGRVLLDRSKEALHSILHSSNYKDGFLQKNVLKAVDIVHRHYDEEGKRIPVGKILLQTNYVADDEDVSLINQRYSKKETPDAKPYSSDTRRD